MLESATPMTVMAVVSSVRRARIGDEESWGGASPREGRTAPLACRAAEPPADGE
jgi:hypothetical protein